MAISRLGRGDDIQRSKFQPYIHKEQCSAVGLGAGGDIMPLDILIICGGEAHHGPDRIWEGDL